MNQISSTIINGKHVPIQKRWEENYVEETKEAFNPLPYMNFKFPLKQKVLKVWQKLNLKSTFSTNILLAFNILIILLHFDTND